MALPTVHGPLGSALHQLRTALTPDRYEQPNRTVPLYGQSRQSLGDYLRANARSFDPRTREGALNWLTLLGPSRFSPKAIVESVDPGGKFYGLPGTRFDLPQYPFERQVMEPGNYEHFGHRALNVRMHPGENAPILGSLSYTDPALMSPMARGGMSWGRNDPLYVESGWVQPRYRGRGVYTDLVGYLMKQAGSRGHESEVISPYLVGMYGRMIAGGKMPGYTLTRPSPGAPWLLRYSGPPPGSPAPTTITRQGFLPNP